MSIPAWVLTAANHPLTTLTARAALAVVAAGFVAAAAYMGNVNATIANVKQEHAETTAADALRFERIEATVDAITKRIDIGREDRLEFQKSTTTMLQTIVTQNQQIMSGQADVAATVRSMEGRVTRLERREDDTR